MGGALYGFLEKKFESPKLDNDWHLVLKTEPILGSVSAFRDIFWKNKRKGFFPKIPKNFGFPDDLSVETRAALYTGIRVGHFELDDLKFNLNKTEGQISAETLPDETYGEHRWVIDLDFYKVFEDTAFWISYDQLKSIDWDQKVQESKVEEVRNNIQDSGYGYKVDELQRIFKLIIDDKESEKLWITHNDEIDLDAEDVRNLANGKTVLKEGKELRLEVRTMREMLGSQWNNLWEIIENIGEEKRSDVRMVFYWNH